MWQISYSSIKLNIDAFTLSITIKIEKRGCTISTIAPISKHAELIDKELEKTVLPDIPLGRRLGTP